MRGEPSKKSRICRLYFDEEILSDIALGRRIWHLPTCNQGPVIIIFGKSSSQTGAENRAVSRSGWSDRSRVGSHRTFLLALT
ncbi:MAG: hypothetical protein EHM80_02895 [Nitrospiraceae bacterium]|nr:MAG: hypothetical protein EHM80_02895 [Nitrospiraceae bacterium]